MLRKLIRTLNNKGQNTAEYALLIALVVAAIIAMQTYAQRSLQGRIRDAGQYLTTQTGEIGTTDQYEPYYLQSEYDVSRGAVENVIMDTNVQAMNEVSNRARATGGFQSSDYEGLATP